MRATGLALPLAIDSEIGEIANYFQVSRSQVMRGILSEWFIECAGGDPVKFETIPYHKRYYKRPELKKGVKKE